MTNQTDIPLTWNKRNHHSRCIITGCSAEHEWMLPWWFDNLRRHNQLPVMFIDMGMSDRALAWCMERGAIIQNQTPVSHVYLNKPLGLIQSPYAEILWTDLDCEILHSVDRIFYETRSEIGVVRDHPDAYDPLQGGVIVLRHGSATALEWAGLCRNWKNLDPSQFPKRRYDQSLLGYVWRHQPEAFTLLPEQWNWGRQRIAPPDAHIIHWWGTDGKSEIRRRLNLCPPDHPLRALEGNIFSLIRYKFMEIFHQIRLMFRAIRRQLKPQK